ncbi:MAG: 3-hydroxyacyl-ACP dehydratase [Taibaiella sp.]|nr:3-hydroxyacyl-ACP dehydratase [Taibaiella sp.]
MLLNDFYDIENEQKTDDSYSCKISFNAAHDIFKGHFPTQPVVPGVCMIEIVKELLQRRLNKVLVLENISTAKFLQLLVPGIDPQITIAWKEVADKYSVNAVYKNNETAVCKIAGNYKTTA